MDADDQIFFIFGLIVMALFLAVSLMKVSELAQQDDVKARFHIEEMRNAIETLDAMHGYVTLPYSTGAWDNYGLFLERADERVKRDGAEAVVSVPRLRLSIGEKADTFEAERGGYDELRKLMINTTETDVAGEFEFRTDFRIVRSDRSIVLEPVSARCPEPSLAEQEWNEVLGGLSEHDVRFGPHADRDRPTSVMLFVSEPGFGCEEFARIERATDRFGTAVTRSVLAEEHLLRMTDEQMLVVIR